MKARWYFWMLAVVMLIALGFLTYIVITQEFSWYFVAAEVLVALVLILLVLLYAKVVKPMQTIAGGMDLLREQDFSSRLGLVGQKDADRVVEVFNKMMERLKNERLRVREQNEFLDLLVKSSPMGLIVMDFDGQVSTANPAACAIFGEDAAVHLPQALSLIGTGESSTIRTDDGNVFKCSCAYFMDRGFHRKFYIIEQMTQELLEAEKKAYGQVIRMLAHEVNNSMAGVTSSLNTVQEILSSQARTWSSSKMQSESASPMQSESVSTLPSESASPIPSESASTLPSESASPMQSDSETIQSQDLSDIRELLSISSDRCLSLSQFISAFVSVVKIPEPQLETVSLNDFVNNRLRFFESICAATGKNITFRTELSPSAGTVLIDQILMEQVVVNIVKNAAEAAATRTLQKFRHSENESTDSQIVIKTSGGKSAAGESQQPCLCVSNNGQPIPPDVADKLFTPFFSTKTNGQGIGLTLIREILLKHGCHFSLRTDPDGWTRFTIHFQ